MSEHRASARWLGALLVLVLAGGCTTKGAANRQPYLGTGTASAVDGIQQITLTVNGTFRFTPSFFSVHPGRVRVILRHAAVGSPHDWQLSGFPGDYVPVTSDGQTNSVTFVAPAPGKYQFVCTIHQRQGQVGTMTVLPR